MNSPHGFYQKTIDVEGRSFSLKVLRFDNGYFVSLSEGLNKIGSTVVSLATGPTPVTTTVIPSKTESLFLKLTAEKISTKSKGIAMVSAFVKKGLEPYTTKIIMKEILEAIQS